jgi:hypothetical protein
MRRLREWVGIDDIAITGIHLPTQRERERRAFDDRRRARR